MSRSLYGVDQYTVPNRAVQRAAATAVQSHDSPLAHGEGGRGANADGSGELTRTSLAGGYGNRMNLGAELSGFVWSARNVPPPLGLAHVRFSLTHLGSASVIGRRAAQRELNAYISLAYRHRNSDGITHCW